MHPESEAAFAAELHESKVVDFDTVWVADGAYEYGRPGFEFRNKVTLAPQEEVRGAHTGRVSIGLHVKPEAAPHAGWYFGFSGTWGRTYKAEDSTLLCEPLLSSATNCSETVIGGPTKEEYRSFVGGATHMDAGPRSLWRQSAPDIRQNVWRLARRDTALFSEPDERTGARGIANQNKLTGGLNVGWREGSGLFVTAFLGPVLKVGP